MMRLVTVFWPLTTAGAGELVTQDVGESGLVVDWSVKPTAFVDQLTMTFAPEESSVNCAGEESGLVGFVLASHSW